MATRYGSLTMTNIANTTPAVLAPPGIGGGKVHVWVDTVEMGSADVASSTALLARIPSNARILGMSKISWDQMTSVAATAKLGLFNIGSTTSFTDFSSAFTTTALATSVAGAQSIITDIANYGKRAWEYTSAAVDPKCDMDVKITTGNDNTVAGTITLELFYATD